MSKQWKIGITGGIGSGKSTVAKMFTSMGAMVYYTDVRIKKIMASNEQVRSALKAEFGEQTYIGTELNREYLASIIFSDKDKWKRINELTYPYILAEFNEWCNLWSDTWLQVIESAILFETNSVEDLGLDLVITVACPEETRIERAMARNNVSREDVVARINNQFTDEERAELADIVITNDKDEKHLFEQTEKVFNNLVFEGRLRKSM